MSPVPHWEPCSLQNLKFSLIQSGTTCSLDLGQRLKISLALQSIKVHCGPNNLHLWNSKWCSHKYDMYDTKSLSKQSMQVMVVGRQAVCSETTAYRTLNKMTCQGQNVQYIYRYTGIHLATEPQQTILCQEPPDEKRIIQNFEYKQKTFSLDTKSLPS